MTKKELIDLLSDVPDDGNIIIERFMPTGNGSGYAKESELEEKDVHFFCGDVYIGNIY